MLRYAAKSQILSFSHLNSTCRLQSFSSYKLVTNSNYSSNYYIYNTIRPFSSAINFSAKPQSKSKPAQKLATIPGQNIKIWCDISDDERSVFDFHDHYKPVLDEITQTTITQIKQIKLGVDVSDLEAFKFKKLMFNSVFNDSAASDNNNTTSDFSENKPTLPLEELALVTQTRDREYDIDLIEVPELYDAIYEELYDHFRGQVTFVKVKNDDKIKIQIPKVAKSVRRQKIQLLKDVKNEGLLLSKDFIKSSVLDVKEALKEEGIISRKDVQTFVNRELPNFFKKYHEKFVAADIEFAAAIKEKEIKEANE